MEEYYFLFGVALIFTIAAVIQDLRTREIANWLNFSFVGIGLSYRAFYSAFSWESGFFLFGVIGFLIFFAVANGFYYSRVFAGGDAKLIMGFGVILPYSSYWSLVYLSLGFVFILFLMGAIWSLIYSVKIVNENKKKFMKEFKNSFRDNRAVLLMLGILLIIGLIILLIDGMKDYLLYLLTFIVITGLLYVYLKALDKCMIVLKNPRELSEGEWLYDDVRVGKKWIRKSVHGLSWEEIKLLRRARKKVLIKDGVPFTPAFLLALIIISILYVLDVSYLNVIELFY